MARPAAVGEQPPAAHPGLSLEEEGESTQKPCKTCEGRRAGAGTAVGTDGPITPQQDSHGPTQDAHGGQPQPGGGMERESRDTQK